MDRQHFACVHVFTCSYARALRSAMARHAEETKRVRGEHEQQMERTRTEHEAQVSELNNALDQVR